MRDTTFGSAKWVQELIDTLWNVNHSMSKQ